MNFQNKFELYGVLTSNYKTPHFPLQLIYHKKVSFKTHRFLLRKVGIFKPSYILGSTRPFPHPKLPTTSLHFIKHPLKKGLRWEYSKLHHRQNIPRIQIRAKQKGQPIVPPHWNQGIHGADSQLPSYLATNIFQKVRLSRPKQHFYKEM